MSLLPKSLLAFWLLLASVLAPSGTASSANNSELQTLIRNCESQNGKDCRTLGWLYANGFGVHIDYDKAAKYFSKGCKLKDGIACGFLGALYNDGSGVSQSYDKAAEYFAKGCKLQDGFACGARSPKLR